MKRTVIAFATSWLVLSWPSFSNAEKSDEARERRNHITAEEQKITSHASQLVFAAQSAERQEVEALGLDEIRAELRDLRREIGRFSIAESQAETLAKLPGAAKRSSATSEPRIRLNVSLSRLASKRAALSAKLDGLKSAHQKRLLRRTIAKLEELDRDTQAAASAAGGKRSQRLAAVKDRLVIERFGFANRDIRPTPSSPTLQMIPSKDLPTLTVN